MPKNTLPVRLIDAADEVAEMRRRLEMAEAALAAAEDDFLLLAEKAGVESVSTPSGARVTIVRSTRLHIDEGALKNLISTRLYNSLCDKVSLVKYKAARAMGRIDSEVAAKVESYSHSSSIRVTLPKTPTTVSRLVGAKAPAKKTTPKK